MRRTFEEFYKAFGLKQYPFDIYTSENESEINKYLFVEPNDYALIKSTFLGKRTMMVLGNRGTGKTAVIYDLIRKVNDEKNIVVYIEDYTDCDLDANINNYYQLIIVKIVEQLFCSLVGNEKKIKNLTHEDKVFLSYLLQKFTTPITKDGLVAKIKQIQVPKYKLVINWIFKNLKGPVNYGAKVLVNSVYEGILKHFSYLPPVSEEMAREILPDINFAVDTGFIDAEASYKMIGKVCKIIKKLNYDKIIAFLDKIDEDNRLNNDAELIGQFIKPLVTDNKLLLNRDIQIIIACWSVPFNVIKSEVRTQKHAVKELNWKNDDLIEALNRRLIVFGSDNIRNYKNLFAHNVAEKEIEKIFYLSNGNPRDLWHIFNQIFLAQFDIDSNVNKLSCESIEKGIEQFVVKFNFYEYYPRKKGAKASSMDIYSYIKHLQKLDGITFTKNKLNDAAGTGGSTQNYVTGMERIGLIQKIDEKINGGVVYKIKDPKVQYAIQNNITIQKEM